MLVHEVTTGIPLALLCEHGTLYVKVSNEYKDGRLDHCVLIGVGWRAPGSSSLSNWRFYTGESLLPLATVDPYEIAWKFTYLMLPSVVQDKVNKMLRLL